MRYALSLALGVIAFAAAAQSPTDTLFVWGHEVDGTAYLRWLPASARGFELSAREGYRIEGAPIGSDEWIALEASPIRALDEGALRAFVAQDSAAVAIADALSQNPSYDADDRRQLATFAVLSTIADRERCAAAGLCTQLAVRPGSYRYRVTDALGNVGAVTLRGGAGLPAPVATTTADFGRERVQLEWPKRDDLAYYYVERRIGADAPWERVTELPKVAGAGATVDFSDGLVVRDSVYAYRVEAFTYTHLSVGYGPEVSGFAKGARSIPRPNVSRPEELPDGTVAVRWTMDPDGDLDRVASQIVQRSFTRDSGYVTLASYPDATQREFSDDLVDGPAERYYRVRAFDGLGRARTSVPRYFVATDTTAPPPPKGLRGTVDRDGVVRLTWRPSRAPDLLGYRVFYSLSAERPGTRITAYHEVAPAATDTLDLISLPDTVYYRVVALDELKNTSDYSEPVGVALPDVHPPIPPVLAKAEGDTSGVHIGYVPSVSPDAETEVWERQRVGTRGWYAFAKRAAAIGEEATFVDATASADFAYEYRVILYDDAGLRAISNVVAGERMRELVPAGPDRVSARLDEAADGHELSWRQPGGAQPERFRIYRATSSGDLTTYRLLERDQLSAKGPRRRTGDFRYRVSLGALLGAEHRYAVRAEWGDGRVSELSKVVKTGK